MLSVVYDGSENVSDRKRKDGGTESVDAASRDSRESAFFHASDAVALAARVVEQAKRLQALADQLADAAWDAGRRFDLARLRRLDAAAKRMLTAAQPWDPERATRMHIVAAIRDAARALPAESLRRLTLADGSTTVVEPLPLATQASELPKLEALLREDHRAEISTDGGRYNGYVSLSPGGFAAFVYFSPAGLEAHNWLLGTTAEDWDRAVREWAASEWAEENRRTHGGKGKSLPRWRAVMDLLAKTGLPKISKRSLESDWNLWRRDVLGEGPDD